MVPKVKPTNDPKAKDLAVALQRRLKKLIKKAKKKRELDWSEYGPSNEEK